MRLASIFDLAPFSGNDGLYISYHEDKPLIMSTKRGYYNIWDNQNYQILGQWEGQEDHTVLINGKAQGAGDIVILTIDSGGGVSLKARYRKNTQPPLTNEDDPGL